MSLKHPATPTFLFLGASYDRLNEYVGLQWPVPDPSRPGSVLMHRDIFRRWNAAVASRGFEHSVANMYFLPIGMLLTAASGAPIALSSAMENLATVTIGNILGGTALVALVYWSVYLRRGA